MPYIKKDQRQKFDENIDRLLLSLSEGDAAKGELNYVIFTLIVRHLHKVGLNYSNANDYIGGVLTCAQQELFRRVVNGYEDGAIERNGDIQILWSK